jgi:hypothetical protein
MLFKAVEHLIPKRCEDPLVDKLHCILDMGFVFWFSLSCREDRCSVVFGEIVEHWFIQQLRYYLYDREFIKVEDSYYSGKDQEAVTALRDPAEAGREKEMLLYSMEAGIIFHSMGDLDSSDSAFRQADEIAQSISRIV